MGAGEEMDGLWYGCDDVNSVHGGKSVGGVVGRMAVMELYERGERRDGGEILRGRSAGFDGVGVVVQLDRLLGLPACPLALIE